MITKHLRMVRGQTLRLTFTVKDEDGVPVDLTGASAYLHIRPDIKAAAIVQLAVGTGITIMITGGAGLTNNTAVTLADVTGFSLHA